MCSGTWLIFSEGGRRVEEEIQHNSVLLNVCPDDLSTEKSKASVLPHSACVSIQV